MFTLAGSLTSRFRDQRLSYLRYALKTAADPQGLFEQERETLHLNDHFRSLLEPLVSTTAKKEVSFEPFPA